MTETADSKRRPCRAVSEETSKSLYFQSLVKRIARQSWLQKCSPVLLSLSQEETMKRPQIGTVSAGMAVLAMILTAGIACTAQEPTQAPTQEPTAPMPEPLRQKADGERHGLPLETYAVAPGTKFLVRLDEELGTKATQQKAKFQVRTLEPLEAGSGIYLPAGAEIRGHISHVEPAGVAGRAKLWLTFDEISTKFGDLPIVAEVVDVPGDHSVKSGPKKEGLIEGRSSTQQDAAQAAAAGAAVGAVKGVKDKDKKEAAEGAALGALTAR